MKGDDIAGRLLDFAAAGIQIAGMLPGSYAGAHIAKQLVRASTGCGANYEEARSAESRSDFVHKVGMAVKEVRESLYWLRLLERTAMVPSKVLAEPIQEADELVAILTSSRKMARGRST